MQGFSETGAQMPTIGAYLLGKTKTWKNTLRNGVATSCFKSLLQLQPGTALLRQKFSLTPDQQSALGGTEAERAYRRHEALLHTL